jgi:periplasmic protein TonB
VRSARPVKAQPRGVFEAAGMQSIMKWKFKPKVVDGKAVEQKAIQRIDFKMEAE